MEDDNLHERVARIEGASGSFLTVVSLVSALLIGAIAIVATLQVYTLGRVDKLGEQIGALPDQINKNLLEVNRTISQAITASRAGPSQPTVIVLPNTAQPSVIDPSPKQ